MSENNTTVSKSRKGFAAMDAARQRLIASLGGKAAHQQGVAHQWSRQEAIAAGKKGGLKSGRTRNANREESDPLL